MAEEDFKPVHDLICAKKFEAAIQTMASWNPKKLATFCSDPAYIAAYVCMQSSAFDSFWQTRKGEISKKFTFQTQPGVCDADLTIGHILYLLAHVEKNRGQLENYLHYLNQALKFNSIHAAQTLVHDQLVAVDEINSSACQSIASTLNSMENLAKRHGTPGYLLLANGYAHLLRRRAVNEEDDADSYQVEQSDAILATLWKYLYLAKYTEDDSQEAIQNAYFGAGLVNSTAFRLSTIDEMIDTCSALSHDSMIQTHAQTNAAIAYKKINPSSLWVSTRSPSDRHCKPIESKHPKR